MSTFWSLWVISLTSVSLALVLWLLLANREVAVEDDNPKNITTGHSYDGIEEYNNPLPKWWFIMFLASIIFGILYLIFYPGMGNYKGYFPFYKEGHWSSTRQLENEQIESLKKYHDSYGIYSKISIEELAQNSAAMKMASRLFANNCAICHGADGGGSLGFPNLSDSDWLYGSDPDSIKKTIVYGRQAVMPAWSDLLGEKGIADVTQYILSISGQKHNTKQVKIGQKIFSDNCVVCHGSNAEGLPSQGAPNLTDDIWLYEGTPEGIRHTLRNGRNGQMPAQEKHLRKDKIHLLTAYVYSLSLE